MVETYVIVKIVQFMDVKLRGYKMCYDKNITQSLHDIHQLSLYYILLHYISFVCCCKNYICVYIQFHILA